MARIDPVAQDADLTPRAAEILKFAERSGAPDPRMVRVMIRSEVGVAMLEAWHYALYKGLLPHRLKEIVRIYLSVAEGCAYCSSIRSVQGRAEGVTDELLIGLSEIESNSLLTAQEKAALRFARRFKQGEADSDEVFAELHNSFTDEEIIELGFLSGMIVGGGSFAKLLHIVDWDVCSVRPADLQEAD